MAETGGCWIGKVEEEGVPAAAVVGGDGDDESTAAADLVTIQAA